jgi:hypothetical protein
MNRMLKSTGELANAMQPNSPSRALILGSASAAPAAGGQLVRAVSTLFHFRFSNLTANLPREIANDVDTRFRQGGLSFSEQFVCVLRYFLMASQPTTNDLLRGPARPIETGNQTQFDRIGAGRKYDRNSCSCSFSAPRETITARRRALHRATRLPPFRIAERLLGEAIEEAELVDPEDDVDLSWLPDIDADWTTGANGWSVLRAMSTSIFCGLG